MRRVVIAALFGAAALAAAGVYADEPAKVEPKLTKKDVSKLMKDAHQGAKSPHARTLAELKKETPDWAELAKEAKAFVAMGEAFKRVDLGYTSPAKYVAGAAALTKAVGDKDKKAANEAFTGLTNSCSACHAYGTGRVDK